MSENITSGDVYPNGVELGKHGNCWVNCCYCKRRQTASLADMGEIKLPTGWTAGMGMDRSVLCPVCSHDNEEYLDKRYPGAIK